MKLVKFLVLCAASGCIAACDDGRITLSVTDAPIDFADEVIVQFSAVAFERDDGTREVVTLEAPTRIDLSRLTGGLSAVLIDGQTLPASSYRAVEFTVEGSELRDDASYVQLNDGRRLPLYVPDDAKDGLRVTAGFTIEQEESVAVTVDFDLRRSLFIVDNVKAELRPQLRFILDEDAATVGGSVAESLLSAPCAPAVYAYEGADSAVDDVGGRGNEPIASAILVLDSSSGERSYTIGFLEAGDYTLALTCAADADDPSEDDDIAFIRTRTVELRAARRQVLNFQ